MGEISYGWLSILPPLIAIALAILSRQVVISLLAGVWAGWIILADGNILIGTRDTIDAVIAVFSEPWQTRVILFTLLMGSLLMLMSRSAGVDGFVAWARRWSWAKSRTGAQVMAWLLGLGIFIESTITCLVVGTISRPLFDRLKISREKLAYICDSTSAPVCILIPFNSWGALILGLLTTQAAAGHLGDTGVIKLFVQATIFNFYAIGSVLLVLLICLTGRDFGPMAKAEKRARTEGKLWRDGAQLVVDDFVVTSKAKPGLPPRLRNMLVPLAVLIGMVPLGIAVTGISGARAEIAAGTLTNPVFFDYLTHASGATAVLWGVLAAVATSVLLLLFQRAFSVKEITDLIFQGAGGMLPLSALMVFAFAIGMTTDALGTGLWAAAAVEPWLHPKLIVPTVFLVACSVAFSTGTSFGTMAIMIPLAVPLAAAYIDAGAIVSMPLVVSAVLGGAVFGDHCSPISDTTIVSSMAAASDHIDHVRTQMPYALVVAGITTLLYLVIGMSA
ncbi:MAG TPA: Na+/H+ antiporter NhaC family protein [Opitutales bacterium]|nr:Na+/H+ antiporter NhaC family protein [Opitutales bacterium]